MCAIRDIQKIVREEQSIFIESGSTLAYLILPIIDNLESLRPDCKHNPLKICTNNIIIYVILLFEEYVEPVLLPGKPKNRYGATFGNPKNPEACDEHAVKSFLKDNNVTALLTTGSFLDVRYGPHVSSRANHDIKKVLIEYANEKNKTNLFIITAENVNQHVLEKKIPEGCKLIFDYECTDNVRDNPNTLEQVKNRWTEHLEKPNNVVIMGASSMHECEKVQSLFKEVHPNRVPFVYSHGIGRILEYSRETRNAQ